MEKGAIVTQGRPAPSGTGVSGSPDGELSPGVCLSGQPTRGRGSTLCVSQADVFSSLPPDCPQTPAGGSCVTCLLKGNSRRVFLCAPVTLRWSVCFSDVSEGRRSAVGGRRLLLGLSCGSWVFYGLRVSEGRGEGVPSLESPPDTPLYYRLLTLVTT